MRWITTICLAVVCYTLKDLKDVEWKTKCASKGYSSGRSNHPKPGGQCTDDREDGFLTDSMNLGPQPDVPFMEPEKVKKQTFEVTVPADWSY